MQKKNMMTVALMAMAMGFALNVSAEDNTAKKQEAVAKVSTDEQAFVAKLSEQNRKAFEQFTADQKKAAMSASCGASCGKSALAPNDAVQKVQKDQSVAATEKAQAAPAEAKAAAPAQAQAK